MPPTHLAQTESRLTVADRFWRAEMERTYGPDAVLIYGYEREGQGEAGTRLREAFEARTAAVVAWRWERRRPLGGAR